MFLQVKEFNRFYQADRSMEDGKVTRHRSSTQMWAVAFMYDQGEDNIYRNMSEDKRREQIEKDILSDKKLEWPPEEIENKFKEFALTPDERQYVTLIKKMDERSEFIDSSEYTLDAYELLNNGKTRLVKGTADQLDKMIIGAGKLYETLDAIRKKIDLNRTIKTSKPRSLSEDGEI